MKLQDIHTIAIVGAGTMGQGIAQIAALADYNILLYDLNDKVLQNALTNIEKDLDKGIEKGKIKIEDKVNALKKIRVTNNFNELKADVVIEAVIEKLEVKREVFEKLEAINGPQTIFATNTSSIPITQIAASTKHPGRMTGMHFFNPAHIMKLVEVISGVATDAEAATAIRQLAEVLGKVPIMVKDSPGFIVNRVARHFYLESLKILEENIAGVETIDKLIESSGFKMGPFRLMDLIGIDTNFAVTSSMFEAFHYDPKFRPNRIQKQKVDARQLGRKTGQGFYVY
ncbi:MAG: 3-hydroxybutyryl-CoA dehydrogenase [Cytophagales bacterium]|nr:3-hydroxybutyryl-CoA dehydrogenase [Cytophagales bacterium]